MFYRDHSGQVENSENSESQKLINFFPRFLNPGF